MIILRRPLFELAEEETTGIREWLRSELTAVAYHSRIKEPQVH